MSVHVSDGTQGGGIGIIAAIMVKLNFLPSGVEVNELISTIFLAAVGAVVGFFAHLLCKFVYDKLKLLFKKYYD